MAHSSQHTSLRMAPPRVELFFKSDAELRERVAFLASRGYTSYNIVNKDKGDDVARWTASALDAGASDVCAHFSIKYNCKGKDPLDGAVARFDRLLSALAGRSAEVLLVSGSNAKPGLDAATFLGKVSDTRGVRVGVAFNPYLAGDAGAEERRRLAAKLATGLVQSVWLQFGSDATQLDDSLAWLRTAYPDVRVVGSVFLPTKKLIAQQKFRPWNGVLLGEDYLSGPEGAEAATRRLLEVYGARDVGALVEAPGVRTAADADAVDALFPAKAAGAPRTLALFRATDLRLRDNPMLCLAAESGAPCVFGFVAAEDDGVGPAARVYLAAALEALAAELEASYGAALVLRRSPRWADGAAALAAEVGATAVCCNRAHGAARARVDALAAKVSLETPATSASLLYAPEDVAMPTGFQGGHWGTLMPFLRACRATGDPAKPRSAPKTVALADADVDAGAVGDLGLARTWGAGILAFHGAAGEAAAKAAALAFLDGGLRRYERDRSRVDVDGATARVSHHLAFGELSPRDLYWAAKKRHSKEASKTFDRRLHWRDLAYFQEAAFPRMATASIRQHYDDVAWAPEPEAAARFEAWKTGTTGYPMVDASMRMLYATGWLPQSARMVVASFLVEYLRVSWVQGAAWFEETLVDMDPAINAMMWQNAGRSGIDQWNFVMSPENASQDPTGTFTRRYVPELAGLPTKHLHRPWTAPAAALAKAGVVLGETYPLRVVDLAAERALSTASVLAMRARHPRRNDAGGYDVVELPGGATTRVFTKREYRLPADDDAGKKRATSAKKGRVAKRRR